MNKKFIVRLLDVERVVCQDILKRLKGTSEKVRRAQVLLKADADGPGWPDAKIAEAYGCSVRTLENLRERLVTVGFDSALERKKRATPPTPRKLDGVVISVGNLTVGGTGKTPMVLWIAQKLAAEGKSVGILTRGYRGKPIPPGDAGTEGSAGEPITTNSSDEVQMLAARLGNQVRFGVGANRFENGSKLAAQGVNWFVLDDGFQHWHLERDLDIEIAGPPVRLYSNFIRGIRSLPVRIRA